MKKNYFLLFLVSMVSSWHFGQVILQVQPCASTSTPITVEQLGQQASNWGGMIPTLTDPINAITAPAVYAEDGVGDSNDACEALTNESELAGKIVFINRGICGFGTKALAAQNAGALAVVIVNNVAGAPISMDGGTDGINVQIPVVMVAIENGDLAASHPNCQFFLGTLEQVSNDLELIGAFAGFNNRSYYQIPASQVGPNLAFYGYIKNEGISTQTDVYLSVNLNSSLYTQSNSIPTLESGIIESFQGSQNLTILNTVGTSYNFTYEAKGNETDGYPFNNSLNSQVVVSENIYAKDNYSPNNPVTGTLSNYIGLTTIFDIFNTQQLYGLDVKFAQNSQNIGTGIYFEIYDENQELVGSIEHQITASDLTSETVTIPSNGAITLNPGTYYVVSYDPVSIFATSGYCPVSSAYAHGGDFFTPSAELNSTPIIRLNFDCQIAGSTPNYEINSFYNTEACTNLCNGSMNISHNGSDVIRVFDANNSLVTTINNPDFGSHTIENLCPGDYKIVGEKLCFNNISDTLFKTVTETLTSSINSLNTSTCIASDGSIDVTLYSQFGIQQGLPYSFSFNWNGPSTGNTTISGNGANPGSTTVSIENEFSVTNSTPYTLTITDLTSNCIHTTTFTIQNNIPQQAACVVSVDETTGNHNIIIWEKPGDATHIDSFRVYREITTNNFQAIGTVGVDELSQFEDFDADPNATGYKYKVTLIDVCGGESELSNFHNTIHLQYLGSGNFQWSQYAIENESNPVASYNVYRDDNGTGDFQILPNGVVPGSQSTFTDVNYANFPNAKYVVDVNWIDPSVCSATKSDLSTSRSNVKGVDDVNTGSLDQNQLKVIKLYPNPTQGSVTLENSTSLTGTSYSIVNTLGQTVFDGEISGTKTIINLARYESGVYYIHIKSDTYHTVEKVIKK